MSSKIIGKKWLLIGLIWFVSIAVLGLLMRLFVLTDFIDVNYKYLLHAHSHVALLGWVYTALFVGIIDIYLDKEYFRYKPIFIFTQITILGMFISFPIQGYAFISISFSTLFLFASYWFVWKVFRVLKEKNLTHYTSVKFLKASLWYLVISSVGPWSLGPIMALGFAHEAIYYNSIYFFLHFLYNGFIVMSIMGFLYRFLELNGKKHRGELTYKLLQWSIVPSYLLSTYWSYDYLLVHIIGGGSALLLFISIFPFFNDLKLVFKLVSNNKWVYNILKLSMFSLLLKLSFQLVSALPILSSAIYQNSKYLVIGYLHLVLLGFVSLFLIAWFVYRGLFTIASIWSRVGIVLFIIGIVLSELLLFYKGAMIWFELINIPAFHIVLFIVSLPIFIGLILILFTQFSKRN